jgi:hypothetical protein
MLKCYASAKMFYLLKHLPLLYLVILKPSCNNLIPTLTMVLYACVSCLLHSCFVENHPIDLEVTNPSFLRWLYNNNQGGRLKIVNTIGHVLCVLLFMNGFMSSVLIAILLFLRSLANSGYRKSMFHHCVASAECLICPTSCLCFCLCYRNNSDSFLFANQRFNEE